MPTYEYECLPNKHRFEVKQSFTDPSLTRCQICGEPVRKVFSAAGIVFKGSGYYVNDSRAPEASSTSTGGAEANGGKGEPAGSGDKGGDASKKPVADKGSTAKSDKGPTGKARSRSAGPSSTTSKPSSE